MIKRNIRIAEDLLKTFDITAPNVDEAIGELTQIVEEIGKDIQREMRKLKWGVFKNYADLLLVELTEYVKKQMYVEQDITIDCQMNEDKVYFSFASPKNACGVNIYYRWFDDVPKLEVNVGSMSYDPNLDSTECYRVMLVALGFVAGSTLQGGFIERAICNARKDVRHATADIRSLESEYYKMNQIYVLRTKIKGYRNTKFVDSLEIGKVYFLRAFTFGKLVRAGNGKTVTFEQMSNGKKIRIDKSDLLNAVDDEVTNFYHQLAVGDTFVAKTGEATPFEITSIGTQYATVDIVYLSDVGVGVDSSRRILDLFTNFNKIEK